MGVLKKRIAETYVAVHEPDNADPRPGFEDVWTGHAGLLCDRQRQVEVGGDVVAHTLHLH